MNNQFLSAVFCRGLFAPVCLCLLIFATPCAAQEPSAETPAAASAISAPWAIEFSLTEHQKTSSGFETRGTNFELSDDGKFHITRGTQEQPAAAEANGVLSAEELRFVAASLGLLDVAELDGKKLAIGYGKSLQPGWEGSLKINQSANKAEIGFSSLRPEDESKRSPQMNKLVTVVFDLKRIAQQRVEQKRGQDAPSSPSPAQP